MKPETYSRPDFHLDEITGFENPSIDEYRQLVSNIKFGRLKNSFATHWEDFANKNSSYFKFLKKELNGRPLVDLGSGFNHILPFAKSIGVKPVIGIESDSAPSGTSDVQQLIQVREDMLMFVAQLKTGSTDFTINGIDETIVSEKLYIQYLAKEITRATRNGGIVFGRGTKVLDLLNKDKSFKRFNPFNTTYDKYSNLGAEIFQKIN